MENNDNIQKSHMIIYTTEDGLAKIETTFDEDTVWLSIDQMAELFQRDRSVIGKHVRNVFKEGELVKEAVWAKFAYTASDGKVYDVDFYNLDVIISVGYRVKSKRGTQFRIWATNILKEYMKKGFAMDDERLKNLGGGGYFKELLERIRDIRASEKVFYRQVLEIYATSIDYDPKAEISIQFFKKVQNKIHYAIHGQTAAEVIYTRADAEKDFMGLTTFARKQPTFCYGYIDRYIKYNLKGIVALRKGRFQGAISEVSFAKNMDNLPCEFHALHFRANFCFFILHFSALINVSNLLFRVSVL